MKKYSGHFRPVKILLTGLFYLYMYIPPNIIEQIKVSSNLSSIVAVYIDLDRYGKARCPFHDDRHASFSIKKDGKYWKCFGCGIGGDVIKFVELIEGVSFLEAVRRLAVRLNIELPKNNKKIEELKSKWQEKKKSIDRINYALDCLKHAEMQKIDEICEERRKLPKSKKDWDSNDYLREQYIDYRHEELDIKMRKLEGELQDKKRTIRNQ